MSSADPFAWWASAFLQQASTSWGHEEDDAAGLSTIDEERRGHQGAALEFEAYTAPPAPPALGIGPGLSCFSFLGHWFRTVL